MTFRVDLSDQAQRDISAIYEWLRSQQAGDAGERWFVALRAAIGSLAHVPSRCPLAPETRDVPVEVRQLLYGRRPHTYRILFTIEDDSSRSFTFAMRAGDRSRSSLADALADRLRAEDGANPIHDSASRGS